MVLSTATGHLNPDIDAEFSVVSEATSTYRPSAITMFVVAASCLIAATGR
jgi:hypothetical protein